MRHEILKYTNVLIADILFAINESGHGTTQTSYTA